MGYGLPTRTVGQVMQQVKRQFGDESGVQLQDSDLVSWINDAQTAIVTKNKILKAKSTTPSVVGQAAYNWPAVPIHQVESLHYKGRRVPNVPFAMAEEKILENDPDSTTEGTPLFWYEWAGQFTFWPIPNSVEDIDIYYTAKPTDISDPNDLLSVPDKYYQDVCRYVLQQAYEMDEDWTASQAKAEQFALSLNEMSEEERTAQHMVYETITLVDEG